MNNIMMADPVSEIETVSNNMLQMIDRHISSQVLVLNSLALILDSTKCMQGELAEIKISHKKLFEATEIEWTTLSMISNKVGLTKDAVRKRLYNGNFEEGVDFKLDGNRIVVHQGAIGRLYRQRRSNNG